MHSSNSVLYYFTKCNEKSKSECHWCERHVWNSIGCFRRHLSRKHKKCISKLNNYFKIHFIENFAVCIRCNGHVQNNLLCLLNHQIKKHNIIINLDRNKSELKEIKLTDWNTRPLLCNVKKILHGKRSFMHSVVGLIVEEGLSPSLFRSKNMNTIFEIREKLCTTKCRLQVDNEIETTLHLSANFMRKDFSSDLHCRLLSIKIDTDVNALPNTFCISTYFIEKGNIQTRILGIIDLKADKELNEDRIKQILHKFNIDTSQIVTAICDSTKKYYKKQVENYEYLNEIQKLRSHTDIFLGEVKFEPYLGSSAQICLLNIFNNSNIFQPFLECRNLVKFISESKNGYFEIFELNNVSPPRLDSPHIPGSTCEMMNDLLKARKFLQHVKFKMPVKTEDQFVCNEKLWSFIEAFCTSVRLLQKTILMYRDVELQIGDFYAQWLKCKLGTEMIYSQHKRSNELMSLILAEILKSIDNITSEFLSKDYVTTCLYLDPRFQRVLKPNQKFLAIEFLKKLWCRFKLYSSDYDVKSVEQRSQLFDGDEDAVLNEFLSHDLQVKDKENTVFEKIEGLTLAFQMLDTNIISFWLGFKKNEPEVYALSNICFATTATEAFYKTRYSHIYKRNDGSDVSEYTKENILNLRLNAHIFDRAIRYLEESEESDTDFDSDGMSDSDETSDGPSTSKANSKVMLNSSAVKLKSESIDVSSGEEVPLQKK